MSDSNDEKPKKKNKRLQCRCMIKIDEATRRGFDVSSDARGFVRCENNATSPPNKPRFCETDKDCPRARVWTKGGVYDKNKKSEKKRKKKKKKKKKKKSRNVLVATEEVKEKHMYENVIKKRERKEMKPKSIQQIRASAMAQSQVSRLRDLLRSRYNTLTSALNNIEEVNALIISWRQGGLSTRLQKRLEGISRLPPLFIRWMYSVDETGHPASGELLLDNVPPAHQIEAEKVLLDNGKLIMALGDGENSPAEIFRILATLHSNEAKDLTSVIKEEFKVAPRKITEILRLVRERYSEERDVFSGDVEIMPLDFMKDLLNSMSCGQQKCDKSAVNAAEQLVNLAGQRLPKPQDGNELCADMGCGPCVDVSMRNEVAGESVEKRCSPTPKREIGHAYYVEILMREYGVNEKLAKEGIITKEMLQLHTENLNALLSLTTAQGGIGMNIGKAKTLYIGITRIREFKEKIYRKVHAGKEGEEKVSEEDIDLQQSLKEVNKNVPEADHLSLEDFGQGFPILITGTSDAPITEDDKYEIFGGPNVLRDPGLITDEQRMERAFLNMRSRERSVYSIVLLTTNWSPLRFEGAIGPLDDSEPSGRQGRRMRSLRLQRRMEIEKLAERIKELGETPSSVASEAELESLTSKLSRLKLYEEKEDLSRGSITTFLGYKLKAPKGKNIDEADLDSVETYLRKHLSSFVHTFIREFVEEQRSAKRAEIESEVVERVSGEINELVEEKTDSIFGANIAEDLIEEIKSVLAEEGEDEVNPQAQAIAKIIEQMTKEYFVLIDDFSARSERFATEIVLSVMNDGMSVEDMVFAISDFLILFSTDLEAVLGSTADQIPGEAYRTQIYMGLISPQNSLVDSAEQYFKLAFSVMKEEEKEAAKGRLNKLARKIASTIAINSHKFLDATRRNRYSYLRSSGMMRDLFDKYRSCDSKRGVCLCFICRHERDQSLSESCKTIKDKTPWDQIALYEINGELLCFDIFELRDMFNNGNFRVPGVSDTEVVFDEDFRRQITSLDIDALRSQRDEYRRGISDAINHMMKTKMSEIEFKQQTERTMEKRKKFFAHFDKVLNCMEISLATKIDEMVVEVVEDILAVRDDVDQVGTDDEEDSSTYESSSSEEEEEEVPTEPGDAHSFNFSEVIECSTCKQKHSSSLKEPAEIRKDVFRLLTQNQDPKANEKAETAETAHLDDDPDEERKDNPSSKSSTDLPKICEVCKRDLEKRYFYTVVAHKQDSKKFRFVGYHIDCFEKGKLHY
jgi:hypothetical protein